MNSISKLTAIGMTALALGLGLARVGAQSRYDFAGTYTVAGTNPDGSAYNQLAVVTDYGDGYRVNYEDGVTGIASDIGDTIAIASQDKGIPAVTVLKIINDSQLKGYWQDYSSNKEGQEIWTQK
jgi:hypothetical protein